MNMSEEPQCAGDTDVFKKQLAEKNIFLYPTLKYQ